MTDLYRRLGWRIDRPYRLLNREVSGQWQWGGRRSAPEALSDLRDGLALDPNMRALVAHGATDLVTPYYENKLLLAQLPDLGGPDRLRLQVYHGGHMFYARQDARAAFRADAEALYRPAEAGR
jgi:carboxypeptidase C (cathepsin A)